MDDTEQAGSDVDEHPAHEAVHVSPGRRVATSVGLVVLIASAFLGSNMFGVRDSLLGSAAPEATTAAASRVKGAGPAPTTPEATRLRSQPWWQEVTTLEGEGPATKPFTIDSGALQWRLKWTCQAGHLTVQGPQGPKPVVDGACPGGKEGFGTRTGTVKVKVTADGPWTLRVEQQVDVPLVEPPLATMTAPGAAVLTRGDFYRIDQQGSGAATIYKQSDGTNALRLEGFFVSPNAELEVRLSPLKEPKTTEEYAAAPSVLVAKLDVTTGALNFAIPEGIDPSKYGSVVIWCQLVHSAYAAATLGPAQ